METKKEFSDQLNDLSEFFEKMMTRGMDGFGGSGTAVWPLFIRQRTENYVYEYPETLFRNLTRQHGIYLYAKTKANRTAMLKFLIDEHGQKKINIHLYHYGLHLLYPYYSRKQQEEDQESIGKKRKDYMSKLPGLELKANDDFMSYTWSSLIYRRYPEVGDEIVQVPSFNNIRMLFTTEEFGNNTGFYYSDADWVEPIPAYRLEVKKWVKEKDPMTPEPHKKGMIEGRIKLGQDGGGYGLRHYVQGQPVYAGSYIEIKFGDGWIKGRYEWDYEKGSPISIHSSRNEAFYIHEDHLVRVNA